MRNTDERAPVVAFSTTVQPSSSQSSASRSNQIQAAAATKFQRSTPTFTHCGKQGHETANCFQLIGFPKWWPDKSKTPGGRGSDRSTRGRGGGYDSGRGRGGRGSDFWAYNTLTNDPTQQPKPQPSGISNFTTYQWNSLANFLNTQKQTNSDKLSGKRDKLLLFGKDRYFDIIFESGASHHMTGDIDLLSEVTNIEPCPITLPNGDITWARQYGHLNLGNHLVLDHVFYYQISLLLLSQWLIYFVILLALCFLRKCFV